MIITNLKTNFFKKNYQNINFYKSNNLFSFFSYEDSFYFLNKKKNVRHFSNQIVYNIKIKKLNEQKERSLICFYEQLWDEDEIIEKKFIFRLILFYRSYNHKFLIYKHQKLKGRKFFLLNRKIKYLRIIHFYLQNSLVEDIDSINSNFFIFFYFLTNNKNYNFLEKKKIILRNLFFLYFFFKGRMDYFLSLMQFNVVANKNFFRKKFSLAKNLSFLNRKRLNTVSLFPFGFLLFLYSPFRVSYSLSFSNRLLHIRNDFFEKINLFNSKFFPIKHFKLYCNNLKKKLIIKNKIRFKLLEYPYLLKHKFNFTRFLKKKNYPVKNFIINKLQLNHFPKQNSFKTKIEKKGKLSFLFAVKYLKINIKQFIMKIRYFLHVLKSLTFDNNLLLKNFQNKGELINYLFVNLSFLKSVLKTLNSNILKFKLKFNIFSFKKFLLNFFLLSFQNFSKIDSLNLKLFSNKKIPNSDNLLDFFNQKFKKYSKFDGKKFNLIKSRKKIDVFIKKTFLLINNFFGYSSVFTKFNGNFKFFIKFDVLLCSLYFFHRFGRSIILKIIKNYSDISDFVKLRGVKKKNFFNLVKMLSFNYHYPHLSKFFKNNFSNLNFFNFLNFLSLKNKKYFNFFLFKKLHYLTLITNKNTEVLINLLKIRKTFSQKLVIEKKNQANLENMKIIIKRNLEKNPLQFLSFDPAKLTSLKIKKKKKIFNPRFFYKKDLFYSYKNYLFNKFFLKKAIQISKPISFLHSDIVSSFNRLKYKNRTGLLFGYGSREYLQEKVKTIRRTEQWRTSRKFFTNTGFVTRFIKERRFLKTYFKFNKGSFRLAWFHKYSNSFFLRLKIKKTFISNNHLLFRFSFSNSSAMVSSILNHFGFFSINSTKNVNYSSKFYKINKLFTNFNKIQNSSFFLEIALFKKWISAIKNNYFMYILKPKLPIYINNFTEYLISLNFFFKLNFIFFFKFLFLFFSELRVICSFMYLYKLKQMYSHFKFGKFLKNEKQKNKISNSFFFSINVSKRNFSSCKPLIKKKKLLTNKLYLPFFYLNFFFENNIFIKLSFLTLIKAGLKSHFNFKLYLYNFLKFVGINFFIYKINNIFFFSIFNIDFFSYLPKNNFIFAKGLKFFKKLNYFQNSFNFLNFQYPVVGFFSFFFGFQKSLASTFFGNINSPEWSRRKREKMLKVLTPKERRLYDQQYQEGYDGRAYKTKYNTKFKDLSYILLSSPSNKSFKFNPIFHYLGQIKFKRYNWLFTPKNKQEVSNRYLKLKFFLENMLKNKRLIKQKFLNLNIKINKKLDKKKIKLNKKKNISVSNDNTSKLKYIFSKKRFIKKKFLNFNFNSFFKPCIVDFPNSILEQLYNNNNDLDLIPNSNHFLILNSLTFLKNWMTPSILRGILLKKKLKQASNIFFRNNQSYFLTFIRDRKLNFSSSNIINIKNYIISYNKSYKLNISKTKNFRMLLKFRRYFRLLVFISNQNNILSTFIFNFIKKKSINNFSNVLLFNLFFELCDQNFIKKNFSVFTYPLENLFNSKSLHYYFYSELFFCNFKFYKSFQKRFRIIFFKNLIYIYFVQNFIKIKQINDSNFMFLYNFLNLLFTMNSKKRFFKQRFFFPKINDNQFFIQILHFFVFFFRKNFFKGKIYDLLSFDLLKFKFPLSFINKLNIFSYVKLMKSKLTNKIYVKCTEKLFYFVINILFLLSNKILTKIKFHKNIDYLNILIFINSILLLNFRKIKFRHLSLFKKKFKKILKNKHNTKSPFFFKFNTIKMFLNSNYFLNLKEKKSIIIKPIKKLAKKKNYEKKYSLLKYSNKKHNFNLKKNPRFYIKKKKRLFLFKKNRSKYLSKIIISKNYIRKKRKLKRFRFLKKYKMNKSYFHGSQFLNLVNYKNTKLFSVFYKNSFVFNIRNQPKNKRFFFRKSIFLRNLKLHKIIFNKIFLNFFVSPKFFNFQQIKIKDLFLDYNIDYKLKKQSSLFFRLLRFLQFIFKIIYKIKRYLSKTQNTFYFKNLSSMFSANYFNYIFRVHKKVKLLIKHLLFKLVLYKKKQKKTLYPMHSLEKRSFNFSFYRLKFSFFYNCFGIFFLKFFILRYKYFEDFIRLRYQFVNRFFWFRTVPLNFLYKNSKFFIIITKSRNNFFLTGIDCFGRILYKCTPGMVKYTGTDRMSKYAWTDAGQDFSDGFTEFFRFFSKKIKKKRRYINQKIIKPDEDDNRDFLNSFVRRKLTSIERKLSKRYQRRLKRRTLKYKMRVHLRRFFIITKGVSNFFFFSFLKGLFKNNKKLRNKFSGVLNYPLRSYSLCRIKKVRRK